MQLYLDRTYDRARHAQLLLTPVNFSNRTIQIAS